MAQPKTKISVEGETQFKNALKGITQQAKVLNAEMKSVTSSFNSETTAQQKATKQTEVLTKQKQVLSEKLDLLKNRYDKVAQATGENSTEALKLKEQLHKTQTELNNVDNALSDCAKELDKTSDKTSGLKKAFKDIDTSKLSEGLSKVSTALTKMAVTGVTVAVAGLTKLVKSSVEAYAETEQLKGGIQKLFGSDMQTVIKNANNAFKTAGLSANEYMESVTSFSASLISSLGNDTKKAAEYANKAIIAMSDNANTFGTDIESIQSAYQGFAKANYTMLDNLKLGYGGTKEEMQRLIEDAEKLSGLELDISSFADITKAIQIVQEEMGIAGSTAKEASSTIQGSLDSLKSSWENLVAGFSDPNANIGDLIAKMMKQAGITLKNIVPAIKTALSNVGLALKTAFPQMKDTIENVSKAFEKLKKSFKSDMVIFKALINNIDGVITVLEVLLATVAAMRISDTIAPTIKAFMTVMSGFNATCTSSSVAVQNLTSLLNKLGASGIGIVSGVGLAVTALMSAYQAFSQYLDKIKTLSDAEEQLSANVNLATSTIDQQNESMRSVMLAQDSQITYCKQLTKELMTLADESGNVNNADKIRAEYILNYLNTALGTEYELTNNQIQNYEELKNKIYELISAKRAEVALSTMEEQFTTGLENQKQALSDATEAWAMYQNAVNSADYTEAKEKLAKLKDEAEIRSGAGVGLAYQGLIALQQKVVNAYEEHNNELLGAYNTATSNYREYTNDIANYEAAYQAMLSGNYEAVVGIMQNGRTAITDQYYLDNAELEKYTDEEIGIYNKKKEELVKVYVDLLTEKTKAGESWTDEQEKQLEEAKRALESFIDTSFEEQALKNGQEVGKSYVDGVASGITAEQPTCTTAINGVVDNSATSGKAEAQKNGREIGERMSNSTADGITNYGYKPVDALTTAVNNAKYQADKNSNTTSIGEGMSSGIKTGINNISFSQTLASKCTAAIDYAKRILGINSPSRVTRDLIGKNLMLGIADGIKYGETGVITQVNKSMGNVIGAYGNISSSLYSQLNSNTAGLDYNINFNSQASLGLAVKDALQDVEVVMDGDKMGRFVTNKVQREVYG